MAVLSERRARLLYCLLGVALSLGAHVVALQSPPKHPVTGRQIANVYNGTDWLDRAEREDEEQPDRALQLIGITPGMIVADVGAGTGYMTVRLALRVGPKGKVYANDLQSAMIETLRDTVRRRKLTNVETVQGTETDARLPAGTIDLALLVDVYHEFWHPQEMLRSIRQSLKPNGRLVLLEFRKEDASLPILETHKMSVAGARTEVEAEGFTFDRVLEQLPRQHILIFRKPAQ